MGIPRLMTTLAPHADPCELRNETVVIDGPALAYHILHVCRVNGIVQPSYQLLADATLLWLDELSRCRVVVQAIYFDGHLPGSKGKVRMDRLKRSHAQTRRLYCDNPIGCPRQQALAVENLSSGSGSSIPTGFDVFKAGVATAKPLADPSFFVPAVIDTLKSSPSYRSLVWLVPGEADAVCARHVAKYGGVVLTSDSDLLLYDLEAGRVAFFRDLHKDADSAIRYTGFAPSSICERLGLPCKTGILRIAHELQQSAPHATLPRIVRACKLPLANHRDYHELCSHYRHDAQDAEDNDDFRNLGHPLLPHLTALDPRLSELVVQLYSPLIPPCSLGVAYVYLPVLIENVDRGSAWQQSTPIRRLAYTLLERSSPRQCTEIREHRRVENVEQKGRLVQIATTAEAQRYIEEVFDVVQGVKDLACVSDRHYWPLVGLALDMRECQRQDSPSLAWHMFQQRHRPSRSGVRWISWDVVHLFAQVQAALYSLRMLRQVLFFVRSETTDFGHIAVNDLWSTMARFPPLSSFPDIDDMPVLLRQSSLTRFVQDFGDVMHVPSSSELGSHDEAGEGTEVDEDIRKLAAKTDISDKTNRFGLLSTD